jgi:TonB family protein
MRRIVLLLLMALATSVLAEVPRGGPKYQTDSGTVSLLRRYLVSGGEIVYPLEAWQRKQIGSVFVLMTLQPDGSVESLTSKHATGDRVFEPHVERTLRGYRFKPGTKGPLLWLVSFDYPSTVIVKVSRSKDGKLPSVIFGRSR